MAHCLFAFSGLTFALTHCCFFLDIQTRLDGSGVFHETLVHSLQLLAMPILRDGFTVTMGYEIAPGFRFTCDDILSNNILRPSTKHPAPVSGARLTRAALAIALAFQGLIIELLLEHFALPSCVNADGDSRRVGAKG